MNADVFIGYMKAFVQMNDGRIPTEAEWNDLKREMNNCLNIGGSGVKNTTAPPTHYNPDAWRLGGKTTLPYFGVGSGALYYNKGWYE